jgi:heme exporter protein A
VGLEHRLHDPVRTFSRGMGQRLAIARVLMHEPAVVLLDEPYTGLDEQATSMLRQLLRDMAEGQQTVILTTHNLGRALDVGDRLAILVRGRIANESPRASLDLEGLRAAYRRCAGGVN